jgi:hypothetical protein
MYVGTRAYLLAARAPVVILASLHLSKQTFDITAIQIVQNAAKTPLSDTHPTDDTNPGISIESCKPKV